MFVFAVVFIVVVVGGGGGGGGGSSVCRIVNGEIYTCV